MQYTEAPADNASLAIAAWWPRLRHEAAIRDLLVDKLADPALGAAAALALAQSPDIQTIKILQDTAGGDSVAARRAQMALDINRDRLVGEATTMNRFSHLSSRHPSACQQPAQCTGLDRMGGNQASWRHHQNRTGLPGTDTG